LRYKGKLDHTWGEGKKLVDVMTRRGKKKRKRGTTRIDAFMRLKERLRSLQGDVLEKNDRSQGDQHGATQAQKRSQTIASCIIFQKFTQKFRKGGGKTQIEIVVKQTSEQLNLGGVVAVCPLGKRQRMGGTL